MFVALSFFKLNFTDMILFRSLEQLSIIMGAGAPIYAPCAVAQQCIPQAFANAGRDPMDIDFTESHTTGLFHLSIYEYVLE
jgi:hypothetical protein